MALVLADRVKETTTTTGTGTYTLAGAVTGFESFGSIGNGNTTFYCCTDGTDFEVGVGTYTSSGTTLARTTILQSSNSDAAVNWTSGTRTIFCTLPGEKIVFKDANGDVAISGGNLTLGDADRVYFGAGNDLEIFSDGNTSYIKENGSGDLRIWADNPNIATAGGNKIFYGNNGVAELYYTGGVKRLETTSGGVSVTGTVTATSFSGDGSGLTNLPEQDPNALAFAIALG